MTTSAEPGGIRVPKSSLASPRRRATVPTARVVTAVQFSLGAERCSLPITAVDRIIRDTAVAKIPNVGPHVEGVINLRGLVVPVVDMKHFLGLGVRTMGDRHRVLIVNHGRRKVGFSVDAVNGVFQYQEDRVQPAPEVLLARVSERFVHGVVREADVIVVLLALDGILAAGEAGRRSPRWSPGGGGQAEGPANGLELGDSSQNYGPG